MREDLNLINDLFESGYIEGDYVEAWEKIKKMISAIEKMANIYTEKRSDVSDMIDKILEGEEINEADAEHRFIKWEHNGVKYEYDTLTTLVSYKDENGTLREINNIDYQD